MKLDDLIVFHSQVMTSPLKVCHLYKYQQQSVDCGKKLYPASATMLCSKQLVL